MVPLSQEKLRDRKILSAAAVSSYFIRSSFYLWVSPMVDIYFVPLPTPSVSVQNTKEQFPTLYCVVSLQADAIPKWQVSN